MVIIVSSLITLFFSAYNCGSLIAYNNSLSSFKFSTDISFEYFDEGFRVLSISTKHLTYGFTESQVSSTNYLTQGITSAPTTIFFAIYQYVVINSQYNNPWIIWHELVHVADYQDNKKSQNLTNELNLTEAETEFVVYNLLLNYYPEWAEIQYNNRKYLSYTPNLKTYDFTVFTNPELQMPEAIKFLKSHSIPLIYKGGNYDTFNF
jgi:hypothetical protein